VSPAVGAANSAPSGGRVLGHPIAKPAREIEAALEPIAHNGRGTSLDSISVDNWPSPF